MHRERNGILIGEYSTSGDEQSGRRLKYLYRHDLYCPITVFSAKSLCNFNDTTTFDDVDSTNFSHPHPTFLVSSHTRRRQADTMFITRPREKKNPLAVPPRKKRKADFAIEEINFDDSARSDYLTGFHKRKVQRQKQAQEIATEKARQEKIAFRKEVSPP